MPSTTAVKPEKAPPPKRKRRSGKPQPSPDNWAAWQRHLEKRRRPKPLAELLTSRLGTRVRHPLTWCLPADLPAATHELMTELATIASGKGTKNERLGEQLEKHLARLETKTSRAEAGEHDEATAWEILAWCHAAPRLTRILPQTTWTQLLDHLRDAAREALQLSPEEGLLRHQLLTGELPLTLAYLFPELKSCGALLRDARRCLSQAIVEATDGEGLPQASVLPELRGLLACWTRCAHLDSNCFTSEAQTQFEWLARQALRMCRADGQQVLADEGLGAWEKQLFLALLDLVGDRDDWAAAEDLLSLQRTSGRRGTPPEPSVMSAWSELAVLRSHWSRKSPQFAVRFDRPRMRAEVSRGRSLLLRGTWDSVYEVDGQPVDDASQWEEVCCYSDEDVDYVELERTLAGGWRVQRQMLLARDDRFLFLADALLGETEGELVCRGRWPLAPDVEVRFADETREGELIHGKTQARILPLALPEWRTEPAPGELTVEDGHLQWETRGRGKGLFHPLLLDLDKSRSRKPLTWRRLTVAEQRVIQPPDVAVGYRIQLGKQQWLIYRAVSHAANRTLLGQNYSHEFVAARFRSDGTSDPLIEIETQ